jgi:hypothetical protein
MSREPASLRPDSLIVHTACSLTLLHLTQLESDEELSRVGAYNKGLSKDEQGQVAGACLEPMRRLGYLPPPPDQGANGGGAAAQQKQKAESAVAAGAAALEAAALEAGSGGESALAQGIMNGDTQRIGASAASVASAIEALQEEAGQAGSADLQSLE